MPPSTPAFGFGFGWQSITIVSIDPCIPMTSTFHSQTIRHLLFIGNWCPKGSSPCLDSTPQLQGISKIELPDSVKQSMGQECHPVHHRYHCCLLGCHLSRSVPNPSPI